MDPIEMTEAMKAARTWQMPGAPDDLVKAVQSAQAAVVVMKATVIPEAWQPMVVAAKPGRYAVSEGMPEYGEPVAEVTPDGAVRLLVRLEDVEV